MIIYTRQKRRKVADGTNYRGKNVGPREKVGYRDFLHLERVEELIKKVLQGRNIVKERTPIADRMIRADRQCSL